MTDDLRTRVAKAINPDAFDPAFPEIYTKMHSQKALRQADAAIAAMGAGVGVKPLEWGDHPADDGPVLSKAKALHGTYFICDDTDDFSGLYSQIISHDDARWWQHVTSTCETIVERVHDDDLTTLKTAAQAHYDAAIRSALEPLPVSAADLQAENDKLRDYGVEMTRALTGLTVGGSEFFKGEKRLGFFEADIEACTKNVSWRLEMARKLGEAKARAALASEDITDGGV